MKLKLKFFLIIASFLFVSTSALGQKCDCQTIVASCAATIEVSPTGSRKGEYGADLKFTANTAQCAKIEYFVDNTPAFTVLPNGQSGSDRIVGASSAPVNSNRVVLQSCRICKTNAEISNERKMSEAEKVFAAALQDKSFDPKAIEAEFNALLNGGSQSDGNMMQMMQSLQQLKSIQSTVNAQVKNNQAAAAAKAAAEARSTTTSRTQNSSSSQGGDCNSAGFQTCGFGGLTNPGR